MRKNAMAVPRGTIVVVTFVCASVMMVWWNDGCLSRRNVTPVWLSSTRQLDRVRQDDTGPIIALDDVLKCLRIHPHGRGDAIHAWRVLGVADSRSRGDHLGAVLESLGIDVARGYELLFPCETTIVGSGGAGNSNSRGDAPGINDKRVVLRWPTMEEAHEGQFLAAMAESRVPANALVLSANGRTTIRDLVEESCLSPRTVAAVEFSAVALAVYGQPECRWFAEPSRQFDEIMAMLLERADAEEATCHGTHVLYSIAAMLNVNRSRPILGAAAEARGRVHLALVGRRLGQMQHSDGAWRFDWRRNRPFEAPAGQQAGWGADVQVTAHHLEWIAVAPTEVLPDDAVIRALGFLHQRLHVAGDTDIRRDYCGYTHAIRSLLVWRALAVVDLSGGAAVWRGD
jgi:hypothetical protein